MNKVFGLTLVVLMLCVVRLHGEETFSADDQSAQTNGGEASLPPSNEKKEASCFFKHYENENIEEISKELTKRSDPIEAFGQLKDESIWLGKFSLTTKILRDQTMMKSVIENKKTKKEYTKRKYGGLGFIAGFLTAFGTGGAIVLWRISSIATKMAAQTK